MKHLNYTCQALRHTNKSVEPEDLIKINELTRSDLGPDDLYVFKLRVCDALQDRVADRMSHEFLQQFADKINAKSIPLLKDHDWSADKQIGRIYKAQVATDDDGVEYVEAMAYTLATQGELIDKIESGILKELSVSFDGKAVCSICGKPMMKDWDGRGRCENQHVAGEMYEDKQCESILTECTDVFEVSIVAVPCQPNAKIIKHLEEGSNETSKHPVDDSEHINKTPNNGGINMKKGLLALMKFGARNKAAEQPDEQVTELIDILGNPDNAEAEATPEEIQAIIEENEELKKKNAELEEELKACKEAAAEQTEQAEATAIESVLDSEVDKLCPLTPTVKENMLRDIDRKNLKIADGKVEGLEAAIQTVSKKYEGLFGKKELPAKETKDAPTVSTTNEAKSENFKKGFNFTTKTKGTPSDEASTSFKKGFSFN